MTQQTPLSQAGQSIWDLPERGSRGPKARQDRAAAAAVAVRIADTDGMAAVTIRRVAAELGLATMSLYTYVPTKGHLAQLMIDQVAAEYAYPDRTFSLTADEARAAVAALADQARKVARRHPWLASLLQRPTAPGPNGLHYLDYFLGLLATSPLDTGARLEVIGLISGFATMYGGMQAALASEHGLGGTTAAEQAVAPAAALARAAASGHYPNLAAALATAGPPRGEDDVFESAVRRLIELALPPAR